ncbi:MAG TPA: TIM barrel protein [Bryobacteraceae bacterium]|nr:TIM barrel protein [Bryobacteraceae bacterium]
MSFTRRQFLAAAAAIPAAAQNRTEPPQGPPPRVTPPICLYSQVLIKIEYADLAPALKSLGFDGCDLSVQPGGHVRPNMASLDLTRAVESLRGGGIDVPVITTALTDVQDPDAREVLGIAGLIKVPLFRAGHWKYGGGDPMARLAEVRRDISLLGALAHAAGVVMTLHNEAADTVGASIWDTDAVIRAFDPQAVGYDFDIGAATAQAAAGGWFAALRLALPRIKMVTASDFYWEKAGGAWKVTACPLGEGMVDWPRFFGTLAGARFLGPVSLHMDYHPANDVAAIQKDLAFLKKQIPAAYAA